jgi:hypothetical protein
MAEDLMINKRREYNGISERFYGPDFEILNRYKESLSQALSTKTNFVGYVIKSRRWLRVI